MRVECNGHLATVLYAGPLKGKSGLFYGLEWDDPTRGKHNGSFLGEQLFICKSANSGSFVPAEKVNKGRSFMDAFRSRYISQDLDVEMDLGQFVVETVGWQKISQKLQDLKKLDIVGLAGQCIASAGDDNFSEYAIQDLDLSRNLFCDWQQIHQIVSQLTHIHSLRLNSNRLLLSSPQKVLHVKVLSLMNNAISSWAYVVQVLKMFPDLLEIHLGLNQIRYVDKFDYMGHLTTIDLENNGLISWDDIENLGWMKHLKVLNLAGNQLEDIKPPGNLFAGLHTLNLTGNKFATWKSIISLNQFPMLTDVRVAKIPIVESLSQRRTSVLARLLNITRLNGCEITPIERIDAELYYLSTCISLEKTDEFYEANPCYKHLCQKHGTIEHVEKPKLQDQMLLLKLAVGTEQVEKRLNPKMNIRAVKTLVARLLYPNSWQREIVKDLFLKRDGEIEALTNMQSSLDAYNMSNGDILTFEI
jgi:hypothetical protein